MPPKPNVLILGGINTCARPLAEYLMLDGEPRVSALRMADKYSVNPPTTYIGSTFPNVLNKPNVEYLQANLANPTVVQRMFDPPAGQEPYSYVFDFTGEVHYERPDIVQMSQTATISRSLGLEAARRPSIKAYVRLTHYFYDCSSITSAAEESAPLPPEHGPRGSWWHETLRMLAAIDGLPLVILRAGKTYGPEIWGGIMLGFTLGLCYAAIGKDVVTFYSPETGCNTVHVDDVAGAAWAVAEWIAPLGRARADEIAAVEIQSANNLEGEGVTDSSKILKAPVFNIVDDSCSTTGSLAAIALELFGVKYTFLSSREGALSLSRDVQAQEDINQVHTEAWLKITSSSTPSIINTPLSVYMSAERFVWSELNYSNKKIKKVTGYQLRVPFCDKASMQRVLEQLKKDNVWPAN